MEVLAFDMLACLPLKNCFAQKMKSYSKWRQELLNSLPTLFYVSYSGLLQPCKTVIKIWQLKIKLSLLYSYKNIKGEWNEKIHYLFCSIHYLLLTIHYLLRVWRHVLSPPLGYKNFPQFPPELPFDLVTFTLFPT